MKLARVMLDQPTVIALNSDLSANVMENDMLALIRSGLEDVISRHLDATLLRGQKSPFADLPRLTPLPNPGKVIAVGRNYMDHIREQNESIPKNPLLFSKFTSCIINPGDDIRWNPAITSQVDYEAELAVIIGKTAHNVPKENALKYVFGYTAANDVTARDLQKNDGQWTRGKGLDTFLPLGPVIVTADEIPDPQNLWIKARLNGSTVQNSTTKEMIFDVATLIAYISRSITLYPGDVILTGTPDGVGAFRKPPIFLKTGDTIEVELEKIGMIRNPCVEFQE